MRQQIVDYALWGVQNEPSIHYRQSRPIDGLNEVQKLPLYTDCSGFVTDCYKWAGAPDPNGLNYNGYGFTGTLLQHLDSIPLGEALPGDLVIFGPGGGDHVVMLIEPGTKSNPWCVSHGQEKGPIKIKLATEKKAHRSPQTVLRGNGLEEDMPTQNEWDDLAGKVNAIVLLATEADNKVKHVEAMLGSLITEFNATKLEVDAIKTKVQA